jgi:GT2 family glycosyltransferase
LSRPGVTVIVPFAGDSDEAQRTAKALLSLDLHSGDELIVVDNSESSCFPELTEPGTCTVRAAGESSSYYARNSGAALAKRPWLLFTDADCLPDRAILDAYFEHAPADRCGVVAGGIRGVPDQTAFLARWARWRAILHQRHGTAHPFRPFGSTANLLVRRAAFEDAGGFCEGIRSGGDAELCWRLQDLDWGLEERPAAFVEHRHRERIGSLVRQAARYGRGRAWLERRFPDCPPPAGVLREAGRALTAVPYHALCGRYERAGFRAVDCLFAIAMASARILSNRPVGRLSVARSKATVLAGSFPAERVTLPPEGTFRIEARRRATRVRAQELRDLDIAYAEDDCAADRARATLQLMCRHPLRALRMRAAGGGAYEPARALRALRAGGELVPIDESGDAAAGSISALTGLRRRTLR